MRVAAVESRKASLVPSWLLPSLGIFPLVELRESIRIPCSPSLNRGRQKLSGRPVSLVERDAPRSQSFPPASSPRESTCASCEHTVKIGASNNGSPAKAAPRRTRWRGPARPQFNYPVGRSVCLGDSNNPEPRSSQRAPDQDVFEVSKQPNVVLNFQTHHDRSHQQPDHARRLHHFESNTKPSAPQGKF